MRVYHYLEAKWALDNIRRRRLKLSKIDDMNDPYEWGCVRSEHEASQWALDKTKLFAVETHSAQCFSQTWNSILMWSHYGDRHKGICLGFDVPDELTREVQYLSDLEFVGNLDELSVPDKAKVLDKLYAGKYEGWRYEQEIRVNGSREEIDEETGQYFVNFGEHLTLREVIAGACFKMSRKPIEEALHGYSDVKIVKLRTSTSRFELVADDRSF